MATVVKKSFAFMAILVVTSLFLLFTSCNNPPATKEVLIPVPNDTSALAKIDHFIPRDKIETYRADFRSVRDSLRSKVSDLLLPDQEAFNKPALLEILKDPRCVGIRIYHGVKTGKGKELRLILVGVDSEGNDLYINKGSAVAAKITQSGGGLEYGQCPPCDK